MSIRTLATILVLAGLVIHNEAACASGHSFFRVCIRDGFNRVGRMIWDTVETNKGCGDSGDFVADSVHEYTAPVSGEYMFTMTVHGRDYKVKMYRMKPGQGAECLEVVQAPDSTGRADSRSASSSVHLDAGEKVWVEVREVNMMDCAYYEPCTFSGYLLYEN